MTQTGIPFVFMRGGTSRGPYFNRADLPEELDRLAEVLIAALGSGHPINIDGIGGGVAVTTKVAMLSPSEDPWADVDYFFAQVSVSDRLVDFKPTCGNILSGVGPAAIEMGLVEAQEGQTTVNIRAVNTEARVAAIVQTPGGAVSYDGTAQIDGVPMTGAGIALAVLSGAVTSGLGYALWYHVLPRLQAAVAGLVQLSVPVIAVLGGAVLLAEPASLRTLGAGAVVLGGIALGLWPRQRRIGSSGS